MAVWLEDEQGKYIQSLFVPRSVATGIFRYCSNAAGKWVAASKRSPQTLPYWSHKRGIKAGDGLFMPDPDNPVADAYSGATPTTSFILRSKADKPLPEKFMVMFEVNQNWTGMNTGRMTSIRVTVIICLTPSRQLSMKVKSILGTSARGI